MARIPSDIVSIIHAGGAMSVTASEYAVSDLVIFAAAAREAKSSLILTGASKLITSDMARIASTGAGHVVFFEDSASAEAVGVAAGERRGAA